MTGNKYNYWCENCTCGAVGKEKDFVIAKPESKEKRKEPCPNNTKLALKLMGVKTYGAKMMDKQTRIASLKKRSKDHFQREVKEVRDARIKRFDTTGKQ